jgi:tetratricopeptide (TPR) repeat protein
MKITRRNFLAAASALPYLSGGLESFAWADPITQRAVRIPPYRELEKFILPGFDEFPGEKTAAALRDAFVRSLQSLELHVAATATGSSPCPRSYEPVGPGLERAVFDLSDRDIQSGWRCWVKACGTIRRSQFFVLPDDVVRFEVAGERDGKLLYRTGKWKVVWDGGTVVFFSPVEEFVASASEPYFRDVTAAAFENADSFQRQLSRGIPYWRAYLDPATGIDIYGSNGIAVGDIDGDGLDEVYVCQPGGLPNRLYKFGTGGRLSDITKEWGVGLLDETSCALFADLRNSGRQDLVVLRSSGPLLFLNEGSKFKLVEDAFRFATAPRGGFTGMSAADFDRDGKLDLYLCCYVYFQSEAEYTYAAPYHDARNGPPNFLFRNRLNSDGSGTLEDCTAETGMNENNDRFSFAPAWCDFNDDGWPDLYVANDFGRKNLYVNDHGKFRDKAADAGVDDIGPGMSASWFDCDRDGKPDLYIANMWTASGQRVVRDQHFAPANGAKLEEVYRRHTMGNSLFRNQGDGRFEDITRREHAEFGRWAWGSGGHDLDNDGEAELFVTCGMLTNKSETDLGSFFWRQVVARSPATAEPSAAYENGWNAINQFVREDYSWNGREPNVLHVRRGDRYYDFSGVSGLDFADDSRAFAITDFDGDGRLDVILKSRLGPQVRVLQNNCAASNHAIAFQLRGTQSNRDAIGARIRVDEQTKWIDCGSGFLSQHSKRIIFGLGERRAVDAVEVKWPSGVVDRFKDLAAGSTYFLVEGSSKVDSMPFRAPRAIPSGPVEIDNAMSLHDTWFLQPIPLPEPQQGPRLLLVTERTELYEIFRRYLFDWRTNLSPPLALLLNSSGECEKVYAKPPSEGQVAEDQRHLGKRTAQDSLPFEGFYVKPPHRDFFKFGAAYLWAGFPEQALPYLEKVLRQTPSNARVLCLVGEIHLLANRTDAAEKSFREAVRFDAGNAEAWSGLADVLDARNDAAGALQLYEKAAALKPDLFPALLNAGLAAAKIDRQSKAEDWFRQALRVDPKSAEAANGLGLTLAKQGDSAGALKYFQQAIAQRRDYSAAINNLGALYVQLGKTNDAVAAFEYGIRVAPDEEVLYLNLGRVYARLGEFPKAREVMQRLLDRSPGNATASRALQELTEH